MNIKNYTSGISPLVTVAKIEQLLVSSGADGIQKHYKNGRLSSLVFRIAFDPQKPPIEIKLPANIEQCQAAFWQDYQKIRTSHHRKTKEDFLDQAERTAWKIMQDWVEVQITLIRLKQVDFVQVFMAYVITGPNEQTFYDQLHETGFRALLEGPK